MPEEKIIIQGADVDSTGLTYVLTEFISTYSIRGSQAVRTTMKDAVVKTVASTWELV